MKPWEKYSSNTQSQEAPWLKYQDNSQKETKIEKEESLPKTIGRGLVSGLENVGLGLYQTAADLGAEFGGAKKILSKIRPDLKDEIMSMTHQDISEALGSRVKEKQQLEKDEKLSYKIARSAAEIAPFLSVGSKMGVVKGSALASGVSSAVAPLEESGLENRAKEGALGAGIGAATGGILSGAGKLLPKKPTTEKILSKVINPQEAGRLANRLEASGERNVSLPDIAGEEVAGLTRVLAKTPGSKNIINTFLNNRTATSSKRVADLIDKDISAEKYLGNIDDLIKTRKEIADPLYKQSYIEGNDLLKSKGVDKKQIRELIDDDRIKGVIAGARKDFGLNSAIPDASVEVLHGARQQVDDIISSAYRAGENNKARSYLALKDKINNVLYSASPTLKKADQTFAGYSALKSAQEAGLNFNRMRPEELRKAYNGLTNGEKDAFKIGVRENLTKSLEQTSEGLSAARKIFAKPENRERLKIVFDNQKEFANFSRKMNDEIRIFNTKNRILGGSRTDINLADEKAIIDKGFQMITQPKTTALNAIADSIKKVYFGISDKNAAEIARTITSKQKSIDALRRIADKAEGKEKQAINQVIKDRVEYLLAVSSTKTLQEGE